MNAPVAKEIATTLDQSVILEAIGVSMVFPGTIALDNADFVVRKSAVTALVDSYYAEVQAKGGGRQDTSALIRHLPLPAHIARFGLSEAMLSPARLHRTNSSRH